MRALILPVTRDTWADSAPSAFRNFRRAGRL